MRCLKAKAVERRAKREAIANNYAIKMSTCLREFHKFASLPKRPSNFGDREECLRDLLIALLLFSEASARLQPHITFNDIKFYLVNYF